MVALFPRIFRLAFAGVFLFVGLGYLAVTICVDASLLRQTPPQQSAPEQQFKRGGDLSSFRRPSALPVIAATDQVHTISLESANGGGGGRERDAREDGDETQVASDDDRRKSASCAADHCCLRQRGQGVISSSAEFMPSFCAELEVGGGVAQRGLMFFCTEGLEYRELWSDSVSLFGEVALIGFVKRWKLIRGTLADRRVSLWHDSLDTKASAMLQEQQRDEYNLKKRLNSDDRDVWILDFGGNLGFTAIAMALRVPHARVVTLEPSPWNWVLLRANLIQAGVHQRVTAFRAGMGPQTGSFEGVHSFHQSSGTSLRENTNLLKGEGAFSASVVTLPTLLSACNISRIALVKLDCEGCEWHTALPWLQDNLWVRIPQLVGEFHPIGKKGERKTQHWPESMTLAEARLVYKIFCAKGRYRMEKGCDDGRLVPLHPP